MSTQSIGLLLCDDLIFSSRVTGTAQKLGLTVQTARNSAALVELARRSSPACIIVDLQNPGLDLPELLRQLAAVCQRGCKGGYPPLPSGPRVVGYGSHVEAATLHAARVAGCDPVWPRSKFVEELAAALPGWLGAEGRQLEKSSDPVEDEP